MRSKNYLLPLLFLGVFLGALDVAIIAPTLPVIEAELPSIRFSATVVLVSYQYFFLLAPLVFSGPIAKYGTRVSFALSVLMFTVGSLLAGIAESLELLILSRCIQGAGAGCVFPVAVDAIGKFVDSRSQGKSLGMLGAAFGIAFLLSPVLGSIALHWSSWRLLFLINVPIGIGAVIFAAVTLPKESIAPGKNHTDYFGVIGIGVVLAALIWLGRELEMLVLGSAVLNAPVVVATLLLLVSIAFVWVVERRVETPVLDNDLLEKPVLIAVFVLAIAAGTAQACFLVIPSHLVDIANIEPAQAAIKLWPAVLAMIVAPPAAGMLVDRVGSEPVILGAVASCMLGCFLLWASIWYLFAADLGLFLVGLGVSCLLGAPISHLIMSETAGEKRIATQSIARVFLSGGMILGSVVLGFMQNAFFNESAYSSGFFVLAVLLLFVNVLVRKAFSHSGQNPAL